ncbi:GNAT family N-acetyltransferase [Epibacterium ulvae]|nr:GNAT family N-acetyltransferase [Epibacterium ulvae]
MHPIAPEEQPRFLPVIARYLMEIAPSADQDVIKKSRRVLNRQDHRSFWLRNGQADLGFAIVLLLPEGQAELSDFTIFPQFRRYGFGRAAATQLLTRFPGQWRMGVSSASPDAAAFWGTCLSSMPNVAKVKTGAPFTACQSKSFNFWVSAN